MKRFTRDVEPSLTANRAARPLPRFLGTVLTIRSLRSGEPEVTAKNRQPGCIAAWPVEAGNKASRNRVDAGGKDDRFGLAVFRDHRRSAANGSGNQPSSAREPFNPNWGGRSVWRPYGGTPRVMLEGHGRQDREFSDLATSVTDRHTAIDYAHAQARPTRASRYQHAAIRLPRSEMAAAHRPFRACANRRGPRYA
jgi:hypothetical protein